MSELKSKRCVISGKTSVTKAELEKQHCTEKREETMVEPFTTYYQCAYSTYRPPHAFRDDKENLLNNQELL